MHTCMYVHIMHYACRGEKKSDAVREKDYGGCCNKK